MKASVRVVPDTPAEHRPARARVEEAATQLGRRGFRVLHAGRFAISVEAPANAFRQHLGFVGSESKGSSVDVMPPDAELARLVDHVEVLPEPSLFSR